MSSSYGKNLTVTIFGQSHSAAIGVTMDGFPAGFPVDMEALGRFLARRAPGGGPLATPRKEADAPEFLCGLVNNVRRDAQSGIRSSADCRVSRGNNIT